MESTASKKVPIILVIPFCILVAWAGVKAGDAINGDEPNHMIDKATGCQYLISSGASHTLTPRMDGDKQMGCTNKKTQEQH